MNAWLIWIAAAGVLGVAELLSMGLFVAPFALGAAIAGLVAASALLFLFMVRPLVLSHRKLPARVRTGTAALVGARAVVLERIACHEAGSVRIAGEVWTARGYGEDEVIEAGTIVYVIEIRGATALVTE